MRDKSEFEAKLIKLLEDRIEMTEMQLDDIENDKISTDLVDRWQYSIFLCYIARVRAMYSLGYDLGDISNVMSDLILSYHIRPLSLGRPDKSLENFFDHLSVFSLAIIVDVKDREWQTLVEKWKSYDVSDRLIDLLILNRNKDHLVSDNCLFDIPFSLAVQALEASEYKAESFLRIYLKKWYGSLKGCYWHNTHKAKGLAYSGYWSFESAAIAKIKAIDIQEVELGPYFPKDF